MNKKLGCIEGKMFTNDANFAEMIECRFAHCCHLRNHTQIFVENASSVACFWIQLRSHQEEPWQSVSAPTPQLPSPMAGPLPKEASKELVLTFFFNEMKYEAFSAACCIAATNVLSSVVVNPNRPRIKFASSRLTYPWQSAARW